MGEDRTQPRNGDARWFGEQDENGVDLSLIRENLRLPVVQRIRKGERGRQNAVSLLAYPRARAAKPAGADRRSPPAARG